MTVWTGLGARMVGPGTPAQDGGTRDGDGV